MIPRNTHIMVDPEKEPDASFAQQVIAAFGQTDLEQATHIISIGGDGMLLRALTHAAGKRVCGIIPPGSNSVGFWTNRGIRNVSDVARLMDTASAYDLKPLRARITFADGSSVVRTAYNDVSIRPIHQKLSPALQDKFSLSNTDVSIQSVLLDLTVTFRKSVIGPMRVSGGGLIVSTPFGSTAMSSNYGGPALELHQQSVVLTGMAVKGFVPVVNHNQAVFDIQVQSTHKRPVMMSCDSFGVAANANDSPIKSIRISTAPRRETVHLLLNDNPGLRAYAALKPA